MSRATPRDDGTQDDVAPTPNKDNSPSFGKAQSSAEIVSSYKARLAHTQNKNSEAESSPQASTIKASSPAPAIVAKANAATSKHLFSGDAGNTLQLANQGHHLQSSKLAKFQNLNAKENRRRQGSIETLP